MHELIESKGTIYSNVGDPVIARQQEMPEEYLDLLKRQQEEFRWNLNGFTKVASIPQAVADKWLREGFDIYKAPANEIIRRLRMEELDLFVTAGNRTV